MTSRRNFLQKAAAVGLAPVAGSFVFTNPYVAGPEGLLIPDKAISAADPLIVVTDEAPQTVAPIEAWVMSSQFDATRLSLNGLRSGSTYEAIMVSDNPQVRLRLDLLLRSDALTQEQLYSLGGAGRIKLWAEPNGR